MSAADWNFDFEAVLEDDPARGGVFAVLPAVAADTLPAPGPEPLRVRATLDGFPHRGELTDIGDGYFGLLVPREVRRAVGKTVGDTLRVTVAPDHEERVIELPADLAAALAEGPPAALAFFKKLDRLDQRAYVRYLAGAKSAELRAKRLTETVYRLSVGRKRAE